MGTLSSTRSRKDKVPVEPNNGKQQVSDLPRSRRSGVVRARLFGFAILLLGLALGCSLPSAISPGAPSETAPGEVSFELKGPNEAALIVSAKINGKGPYDFVLDTGATFTCVDRQLAEELKLPDWSGPLGTVVIAGGEGEMGFVKIDKFQVGDTASASELAACKLDLSRMQPPGFGIKGLVGLNFLKNYRLTIDFQRRTLRLDKPA
jgi:predicted aspartyl protease